DKSEDWPRKFFGELHQAYSLAITLRLGHPEISIELLFCIAGLLCSHHNTRLAVKACKTSSHCRIILETAIAVQFREIVKKKAYEIEEMGALRVTRELYSLPRSEPREHFFA